MGYNTEPGDIERSANEALTAKVSMENVLTPKLNSIFRSINDANRSLFSISGTLIDPHEFDDEISAALKSTYAKGTKLGGDRILSFIKANPDDRLSKGVALLAAINEVSFNDQVEQMRDRIQVDLRAFSNQAIEESTRRIGDTTSRQLIDQLQRTEQDSIVDGVLMSNREIAKVASAGFAAAIPGRTKTIAMTEAQNAFEGAAEIERNVVHEELTTLQIVGAGALTALPVVEAALDLFFTVELITDAVEAARLAREIMNSIRPTMINRWVNRGDEVVRTPRRGQRFNHVDVDGQLRLPGVPFNVSGELLMRPSDKSLGASVGNVINCRCTLVSVLDIQANR